jgi:predicted nucleic acid-binding protein
MKYRVYLDNCCFNRPYDDQSHPLVRLETEAKLLIQNEIANGNLELVWSFILHSENNDNPYPDRAKQIYAWEAKAVCAIAFDNNILLRAKEIMRLNTKEKDALHISCAIAANADFFITTDKKILNKSIKEIGILNPIDFIRRFFHENR